MKKKLKTISFSGGRLVAVIPWALAVSYGAHTAVGTIKELGESSLTTKLLKRIKERNG